LISAFLAFEFLNPDIQYPPGCQNIPRKKSDVQIFKDGIFINLTLVIMKIIFDKKQGNESKKKQKRKAMHWPSQAKNQS
jgi:hypothetical protein